MRRDAHTVRGNLNGRTYYELQKNYHDLFIGHEFYGIRIQNTVMQTVQNSEQVKSGTERKLFPKNVDEIQVPGLDRWMETTRGINNEAYNIFDPIKKRVQMGRHVFFFFSDLAITCIEHND